MVATVENFLIIFFVRTNRDGGKLDATKLERQNFGCFELWGDELLPPGHQQAAGSAVRRVGERNQQPDGHIE